MKKPVRVLVVDDSAVISKALSLKLNRDAEIEVVGRAANGAEALAQVSSLKPDVVTMDINMPVMDGLTALEHLMEKSPLPVIMISSLTTDGAEETIAALEKGALDFLPKETCISASPEDTDLLLQKIKTVARSRAAKPGMRKKTSAQPTPDSTRYTGAEKTEKETALSPSLLKDVGVVLIGASTGGPGVLLDIIPHLPSSFPVPIVIIQHMPANFTNSLAQRLDKLSSLPVLEAFEGCDIRKGHVYLAPGGKHIAFHYAQKKLKTVFPAVSENIVYKPSVDVAASSLAEVYPGKALAIMLTGMGHDGVNGFRALKEKGSLIIAQSKHSSVIYGMPRAVVESGLADAVQSTRRILETLKKLASL